MAIVVAAVTRDRVVETSDFDSAAFVVETDVITDGGVPGPRFDSCDPDTARVSSAAAVADIVGHRDGVGIRRSCCDDARSVPGTRDSVFHHGRGITAHLYAGVDHDIAPDESIVTGTLVRRHEDAVAYVTARCSSGYNAVLDLPMSSGAGNPFATDFEDFALGDSPIVAGCVDCCSRPKEIAHIEPQIFNAPVIFARNANQIPARSGGNFQDR